MSGQISAEDRVSVQNGRISGVNLQPGHVRHQMVRPHLAQYGNADALHENSLLFPVQHLPETAEHLPRGAPERAEVFSFFQAKTVRITGRYHCNHCIPLQTTGSTVTDAASFFYQPHLADPGFQLPRRLQAPSLSAADPPGKRRTHADGVKSVLRISEKYLGAGKMGQPGIDANSSQPRGHRRKRSHLPFGRPPVSGIVSV